ncbi:hypothetical protein XM38_050980 [Halomicronema hongdechloris C2206]|uniref:Uncharacterized protein n=1 Tax=Halomicronema hongdechloris C2206 TaxID=1641165 RepID=A0A1Z3HV07_9CYAN|nr:hypothetical protein XM38_050980 [Halomicronema hongdechloris C2206]
MSFHNISESLLMSTDRVAFSSLRQLTDDYYRTQYETMPLYEIYSVYASNTAIELLPENSDRFTFGRFICSRDDYQSALKFATNLAEYKRIPLKNYAIDNS